MRRFVEPTLWAVAAAAPLLSPLAGQVAVGLLVVAATARASGRRAVWAAARRVPPAVLVGVVLLMAVHVGRGAPWLEPLAVGAWALLLAAAVADPGGRRRPALAVGAAAGIVAQGIAIVPVLGVGRVAGWVGHPNLLAAGVVLSAVLLVVAAPRRRSRARWAVVGFVLVAVAVALATGSRGTWLGAALGAAAWAFVWPASGRGARVRRVIVWGAIVATGAVVGGVRGFAFADLLRTDVERAVVQGVAVSLAAERPVFGHGGAPWAELAQRVEPSLPTEVLVHAHSLPLHLAARGGALALALLLLVAWRPVRQAARTLAGRARDDPAAVLALSVAAGVLGVQSLLDLVVLHPSVYLAAWLVLVAASDRWRDVSSEPVEGSSGT